MKTRILSAILAVTMLLGCCVITATAIPAYDMYPELIITEIGVDQFGAETNAKNTNTAYNQANKDADPYEFFEILNNSNQSVNVFDYMLAYQGAGSDNAEWFEHSIQEYTPLLPGADWIDANYTTYDSYWKNVQEKRPVNPAYSNGVVQSGEVFVVWVYNESSHLLHCNEAQFRSFWNIDAGVKVFLIDGSNVGNEKNFSLKNQTTGSYIIMHQSERFPARRSADIKYDCEMNNTHHNYEGTTYQALEEVISWAVVDYKTEPLSSYATANGANAMQTNFTISYIPYTSQAQYGNGFCATSFASKYRAYIKGINSYENATVGKLDEVQTAAFASCGTNTVKTLSSGGIKELVNNNDRPELIITEISTDQYGGNANNTNDKYKLSTTSDPFEFLELYNNSTSSINIYDYMIGYQGGGATSVSTWFERSVQEYTPIIPGADWIDAPFGSYDSLWTNSAVARPVNTSYADGELKPGETCILWCYSGDSYKMSATIEEFRAFWSVPETVKVFLFDANSSRGKNFNIKNSDTGEYIVMKPSERFPARRSDDTTYYTECDRTDYYYFDKTFYDMADIISWAVVDYGNYDPLYTFSSANNNSSMRTNYTLAFAPYNGDNVFTNGFLTVSFRTGKRVNLLGINQSAAEATPGTQSSEQTTAIAKAIAK